MQLMPPSLRPWVPVPVLDREQLKSLQVELVWALGEMEGVVASLASRPRAVAGSTAFQTSSDSYLYPARREPSEPRP